MRVAKVDLEDEWDKLIKGEAFKRPHKDERLKITYGVRKAGRGKYGFFVTGTENKQKVTLAKFVAEERAGGFRKQFNRLRKLRPGGQERTPGPQPDLAAGAENCGFYCQDPRNSLSLLERPLLGVVASTTAGPLHFSWNVYPNLSPFEPGGHFLLLPRGSFPELPHFPQLLSRFLFDDLVDICRDSENLMVFFNSRHAGATQDHVHLQAVRVANPEDWALYNARVSRFRGGRARYVGVDYPLNAVVYELADTDPCWDSINNLQREGVPFNLIFLGEKLFLAPRDINNEVAREFPNVLASMEIAGKFIIAEKKVFDDATEARICGALRRIGLALDDILSRLTRQDDC